MPSLSRTKQCYGKLRMFTEVELYLEVFPVRAAAAAATSKLSTVAVAVVVVVVPHAVREEKQNSAH